MIYDKNQLSALEGWCLSDDKTTQIHNLTF